MSAELRCSSEPISWLRLEQHHAGALEAPESRRIAAHLAACAACAACLARIATDAQEPLPALGMPSSGRRLAPPPSRSRGTLVSLHRAMPVVVALAFAAALLLVLGRRPALRPEAPGVLDPVAARTKGGGVGLLLVREDEHVADEAGGVYRDGDRWKAVVSCPLGMHAAWDVVVFERGEAAFPLEPLADLACGNDVPLPGAFRTTGRDPMTVCLVWNEGALVDRAAVRGLSPDALPRSTCAMLTPAP